MTPRSRGSMRRSAAQLDTFGNLLDAVFCYVMRGSSIDRGTVAELAAVADLVCRRWRERDAGIWEVRTGVQHFTHSKVMCWVALDRAARLAEQGILPRRHLEHWRQTADLVGPEALVRAIGRERAAGRQPAAGGDHALRRPALGAHADDARCHPAQARSWSAPVPVPRRGRCGRWRGAFLCCSFWLVEALALAGRRDEAVAEMSELLEMANDVGLYSEELDPATVIFSGTFPRPSCTSRW